MKPASADGEFTVTLSASPSSITVTAGSSASTTITFHISIPPIPSPTITCSGLPPSASCSTNPNPLPTSVTDGYQFTLTISVPSSTAIGTYSVTVQASFTLPAIIQPALQAISGIQFGSSGGVGPNSISIQQFIPPTVTITVTVNPAPVPEYPLGIPLLAIFMIIVYGLIKRRTRNPKTPNNQHSTPTVVVDRRKVCVRH